MTPSLHLKTTSNHGLVPWNQRSDVLVSTSVPYGRDPRAYYLLRSDLPPPVISSSEFVPRVMIEHLLRNKRDSALGAKFVLGSQITNMEGVMHTYVIPVVLAFLHGDYSYRRMHTVLSFPSVNGKQQARTVIISALVQPDFETTEVMLKVSSLSDVPVMGKTFPSNFEILPADEKQDDQARNSYDEDLRRHMIAHLVSSKSLPAVETVRSGARTIEQAVVLLEKYISSVDSFPTRDLEGVYVSLDFGDPIISLELLFNSALHQMRNEFTALEALCPQGYVYTFDPPAIFALHLDAELLNRLTIAAVKVLAQNNSFAKMRVYAFNDYADRQALSLLKEALKAQAHVVVLSKAALFPGPGGFYRPPREANDSLLVLHNNSDAFGQNIQTELPGGSMDGALGGNSSAAASLRRDRADLLDHIL